MDFLFSLLNLHLFTAQIIVEKLKTGVVRGDDADSFEVGLNLNSNLGTLDAIFASLSMILVSEVSNSAVIFFYSATIFFYPCCFPLQ